MTTDRGRRRVGMVAAFASCPDCEGDDFGVEERAGAVVFRCLGCGSAWRYGLGYVWRITERDPVARHRVRITVPGQESERSTKR